MLLQGIWLPLHGYSYESTPFWGGVFMLPLTIGFVIMGLLLGWLSDRYGSRLFATAGLLLITVSFLILAMLQNSGMVASMAMFFTIVIVSLTHLFPRVLAESLTDVGASNLMGPMSVIPPTGALFAVFLGYNPINTILDAVP